MGLIRTWRPDRPPFFPHGPAAADSTIDTNTMKITTSLVLALGLAATPVAFAKKKPDAAPAGKPTPAKGFAKRDTDGDGFLSKEEFLKGAKDNEKAAKAFEKKDKDGDGKLSPGELASGPKAPKPDKPAKPGKNKDGN